MSASQSARLSLLRLRASQRRNSMARPLAEGHVKSNVANFARITLTNYAISNKTSRETQVKVDGPGRRRPKEDENCWLEGEGRG